MRMTPPSSSLEGLDGSEDAFATRMNALAERIGMTGSRFANPTGADAPGAVTTTADLGRLAAFILTRHKDRYGLFSLPEFTWNGIFQRNKNPLLGEIAGVDGLAAGYSAKSGYNGVGSAVRANRRLIGVVAGHPTADARTDALKALFDSLEKYYEDVVPVRKGRTAGAGPCVRGRAIERRPSGARACGSPSAARQQERLPIEGDLYRSLEGAGGTRQDGRRTAGDARPDRGSSGSRWKPPRRSSGEP
ncbi:MAG: D-alanyl-D-alanine carboxypeptidase [Alphaproteobacteria bacterium]|nr:D-alanyl-D-alanine carboxypeptidase [Alphaproteobacteria bacterium]